MSKYIFIFILLISTLFSSCFLDEKYECPAPKTLVSTLSDAYKNAIPYKGFDTLTFVRTSVGDTHTFYGTGVFTGFDEGSFNSDMNCPDDKTKMEREIIQFVSPTFPDPITFNLYFKEYQDPVMFSVNFRHQDFMTYYGLIINPNSSDIDSLLVGGKNYYSVFKVNDLNNYPSTNYYLLYNSLGILKFKFSNNETWELISK